MKHWKETIFAVPVEADNIRQITEMTRADYLREYWADECNTPKGFGPRLFVEMNERKVWALPDGTIFDTNNGEDTEDVESYIEAHNEEEGTDGDRWPADPESYSVTLEEYEIRRWMPNGRNRLVETYTTEEEAEHELYLMWENNWSNGNTNSPTLCETMEEARELIAERRSTPRNVKTPRIHPIMEQALLPFIPKNK